MEARWIEVQFYYLCINILEETRNVDKVLTFIEGMSFFQSIKTEALKILAYDFLTKAEYQPTKSEYAILAYLNKVPTRRIMKHAHLNPPTFWQIIKNYKSNPTKFYSRLTPDKHDIIKKMLQAVEFLKELL